MQKSNSNEIRLLDAIINSTIEGILVFNQEKVAVRVNKSACEIFGYSEKEILGKKAFDFVADESKELVKSKININDQPAYEALMVRKDGSKFPAILRGRNIIVDGEKLRISAIIDISELKNKEKEIYKIAYFDTLTGLPNRQKLVSDMNVKAPKACVIFDINGFGEINDLFGAKIGDQVLSEFAKTLSKRFKNLYKISGDEFAILFEEDIDENEIVKVVKDTIQNVEKIEFFADNEPFHIQIRAGIALKSSKLLTHADIAVREAKNRRLSYFIYKDDKNVEEKYKKNLTITFLIRKALEKDKIICFYQPIVNNNTGKIIKYETLVRLLDDNRIIPPNEFLPVVKTTKLYPEITKTVLKKACEKFKDVDKQFSINLSINDIEDKNVVNYIEDTIKKYKVDGKIIFEILETEGINNYGKVENFIENMKKFNVQFAIDDFGSGYSNFKHILSLDIDYIKIDGSLIKDIVVNDKNKIIVETIVSFAKKMGAKTIAEYVSSEDIYKEVKRLGIDCSQGFYLGKPSEDLIGN